MPKTRVIVQTTDPKTGNPLAAGAEVDLDEESYNALRQQGAVEASEEERQAHATPEAEGNYSARTSREGAPTPTTEPTKPPESPPEARKK